MLISSNHDERADAAARMLTLDDGAEAGYVKRKWYGGVKGNRVNMLLVKTKYSGESLKTLQHVHLLPGKKDMVF